jgi:hypothetical protein
LELLELNSISRVKSIFVFRVFFYGIDNKK